MAFNLLNRISSEAVASADKLLQWHRGLIINNPKQLKSVCKSYDSIGGTGCPETDCRPTKK